MKKGEKDQLTDFVRGVMSHKSEKGKVMEDKPTAEMLNDKFVWKAGDLIIEKAPKKPKKTVKNEKK